MKLNRELSLLCRLEVKHCVLDYSWMLTVYMVLSILTSTSGASLLPF